MDEQKDPDPQPEETPANAEPIRGHDGVQAQPEPPTSTYQPTMDTATGLAFGPNAVSNVTNNYNGPSAEDLVSVIKTLWSPEAPQLKTEDRTQQAANNNVRLAHLRQNLEYEKDFLESESEVTTKTSGTAPKLPQSSEGLEHWYTLLTTYERCFVQVAAVFHGAPLSDIIEITDKRHQPIWEREQREIEQKRRRALTVEEQTEISIEDFQPEPPHRSSRRELLAKICTTPQHVNGVRRLYWQGADRNEQYTCSLRMLEFLAEETGFLVEASFGEQLALWPEQLSGECAWKAAYALGVTLYSQNADDLWRVANKWGNSTRPRDWRLAASLLSGAYNLSCLKDPDHANNRRTSPIFRLLNQWAER